MLHHRDRVFAGGDGVAAGGVHDDDSPPAGGRDVHVVQADAGTADDLQPVGEVDDLLCDICGAPDDQGVIILDHRLQFVGGHLRSDVHLDSRRLFEYLDSFFGQVVADQHSLHGSPPPWRAIYSAAIFSR
jgi:hypothetical protein